MLGLHTANAQFFVRVRPLRPPVVILRPPIPSPRHIWIEEGWRWNKRQQQYIWVEGHWAEPRAGKVWIEGHWMDGPRGSKWIPGHWGRRR